MKEEFVLRVLGQILNILGFDSKFIAVIWNFHFNLHTISNNFAKYEHLRLKNERWFALRDRQV